MYFADFRYSHKLIIKPTSNLKISQVKKGTYCIPTLSIISDYYLPYIRYKYCILRIQLDGSLKSLDSYATDKYCESQYQEFYQEFK